MEFERTITGSVEQEPAAGELPQGLVVGRYVLLGELGSGAMGVVHMAFDPELDRKVALKLVAPHVDSNAGSLGHSRLLREAQALARLSHPNVVSVYDAGTHGGRVWIAMEFVAGQTLGAWARAQPRRWPELLRVLTEVARGVAAAHAAGLVHRDLKPENVMVGDDGRVRVMDFGLAHGRNLTAPLAASGAAQPEQERRPARQEQGRRPARPDPQLDATMASGVLALHESSVLSQRLTVAGAMQGTPAYMAPEQWQGQEAEAATDQFSWAVMAWELLHGERPFTGATALDLAQAVLKGERTPPRRGHRVPGWLHRAVERGLATEPAARWPTMATLVAHLERGRTRARTRRAVLAALGLGVAAAGVAGYRHVEAAQRVAACEAAGQEIEAVWNDEARAAVRTAFMATELRFAETTAARVGPWLDRQVEAWRDARSLACVRATVTGTWDADTLDRAEWCLDERRMAIESLVAEFRGGDKSVVQWAVQAAAGLRGVEACLDDDLLRRHAPPPVAEREAVRAVRRELVQAYTLAVAGRAKEALAAGTAARERAEGLGWAPLSALARGREAAYLREAGKPAESEEQAVAAYFEAADAEAWAEAAGAAIDLTFTVGVRRARAADGRMWARHAATALRLAGDPTGLSESDRLSNLALVHGAAGEYAQALALQREVLGMRERVVGPTHPLVARILGNMASTHRSMAAYPEARALHERALAILEETLGPDHPEVAAQFGNMAIVYSLEGQHDEAKRMYELALARMEAALGPEHPNLITLQINLASTEKSRGAYPEARALYERALALAEKVYGREHPTVALCLNNLANLLRAMGQVRESRPLHERALAIREKVLGPDHPDVAQSLQNLAILDKTAGDYAQARLRHERALAIREKALGANHPDVGQSLINLSALALAQKDFAEAKRRLTRALAIYEALNPEREEVGHALRGLAEAHRELGEYSEAQTCAGRSLAIFEKALGPAHPEVASGLASLAEVLLAMKRPADALPLAERAVAIDAARPGVDNGEPAVRYVLAQALVANRGDRARALAEAEQAREGFKTAGMTKELQELEVWAARTGHPR